MRWLIFRLFTGLLTFTVGITFAAWFIRPASQVITLSPMATPIATAQVTIPDGWKKIDLRDFSFYVPPDMKKKNVRGIDSAVWEFRNRSMTLGLDYGMYSNDLQFYSDQPEYRAEWIHIDGKKARIATLRMNDKDRKFVAAVYFPDVSGGDGGTKLTFWASCVDSTTQETAKRIFLSIRFK